MKCKSPKRNACVVYHNNSTREIVGKDNEGKYIIKHHINFVEDRCPNENECEIKCGEPRGLKFMVQK